MSTSKQSRLLTINCSQCFLHYWKSSWNPLSVMASSKLIAFSLISSMFSERLSFKLVSRFGNKESLLRLSPESMLDRAQLMSDILPDNWGMMSDAWAGVLLWSNIQVWFSHNSGFFLHTASLKSAKSSWYNCLFTIWPRGTNFIMVIVFSIEKSVIITLIFVRLIRVFLVEETLSTSTVTIANCFQHQTDKPSLISYYDVHK